MTASTNETARPCPLGGLMRLMKCCPNRRRSCSLTCFWQNYTVTSSCSSWLCIEARLSPCVVTARFCLAQTVTMLKKQSSEQDIYCSFEILHIKGIIFLGTTSLLCLNILVNKKNVNQV